VIGITSRPTFDPARSDMLELAHDMRLIRTFTPSAPMHKCTLGYLARWAITGATNYAKPG